MSIISGGSSGGGSGAVTAISSTTAAATAASLSITGIPPTFTHLQVMVANARCDLTTGAGIINIRFNGDSAADYDFVNAIAFGSGAMTVTAIAGTVSARIQAVTPATAVAGAFANVNMYVQNYASTTFYKQWTGVGFRKDADALGNYLQENPSGSWRATVALTSVQIFPVGISGTAQNFQAGTGLYLYGIT